MKRVPRPEHPSSREPPAELATVWPARPPLKGNSPVKYMLQVRFNGADAAIARLSAHERDAVVAEFESIGRLPGVLDGNQLQPAVAATTVRISDGQTETAPGPAVSPTAALDGYYLYDAPDLDAAIALAARIPATRLGATIEIRPVVER